MKKYIEGFKQFVAEANDDYIEGIIQSVPIVNVRMISDSTVLTIVKWGALNL